LTKTAKDLLNFLGGLSCYSKICITISNKWN